MFGTTVLKFCMWRVDKMQGGDDRTSRRKGERERQAVYAYMHVHIQRRHSGERTHEMGWLRLYANIQSTYTMWSAIHV